MTDNELIAMIEAAFAGVTLEEGVGLFESQALDDRLAPEIQALWRARDENDDWHNIPLYDLFGRESCLSFFDPKGMRFHLPQILLYTLDAYDADEKILDGAGALKSTDFPFPLWHLTRLNRFDTYFSALNADQVACVIAYLEYAQSEYIREYPGSLSTEDLADIASALPTWRARKAALEAG